MHLSPPRLAAAPVLFLLLAVSAVAQPPAPGALRPMLKLHDTEILAAGPAITRTVDQDIFVAEDGTLVSVTVAADLLAGSGFASTIIRGAGSSAQLDALRTALYQNRVGLLSGSCDTELRPLGSTFTIGISWFGRGSRSSQFTITNQGNSGRTCSPREPAVLQAIETFQAGVIADPATEIQSSACTSTGQCPSGLLCCSACGIPDCAHACLRPAVDGRCPAFP
jgi:hypothetical protein